MKLTFKVEINAQTPYKCINSLDDYLSSAQWLRVVLDDIASTGNESWTRGIPVDKLDAWHGVRGLKGYDKICSVYFDDEIDRDSLETILHKLYLHNICDTDDMLCDLPAVSLKSEMPNARISFYLCPLVDGEVPSEVNYKRIIRAIKNMFMQTSICKSI
jgi:hypothetical protein